MDGWTHKESIFSCDADQLFLERIKPPDSDEAAANAAFVVA